MINTDMNNTDNVFRNELKHDENLLWSGHPKQGLVLRPSDGFLIPFSILWAAFSISWEYRVVMSGAPFFFVLWGIPFLLVGFYITVGRFFVDAQQRKGTFYALTNQRAIILTTSFQRQVRSLNLKNLPETVLVVHNDNSGTITFGQQFHPLASWYAGMPLPGRDRYLPPSFELIDDAQDVYNLILKSQREL